MPGRRAPAGLPRDLLRGRGGQTPPSRPGPHRAFSRACRWFETAVCFIPLPPGPEAAVRQMERKHQALADPPRVEVSESFTVNTNICKLPVYGANRYRLDPPCARTPLSISKWHPQASASALYRPTRVRTMPCPPAAIPPSTYLRPPSRRSPQAAGSRGIIYSSIPPRYTCPREAGAFSGSNRRHLPNSLSAIDSDGARAARCDVAPLRSRREDALRVAAVLGGCLLDNLATRGASHESPLEDALEPAEKRACRSRTLPRGEEAASSRASAGGSGCSPRRRCRGMSRVSVVPLCRDKLGRIRSSDTLCPLCGGGDWRGSLRCAPSSRVQDGSLRFRRVIRFRHGGAGGRWDLESTRRALGTYIERNSLR